MTLKHIYTKLDNTKNLILGKETKPEERKGKRTKEEKETFASNHTSPSANMRALVMTQPLFEAFNAWTCVDIHKA